MALKHQMGKRTYFGEPASIYKQLAVDGSLETVPFLTAASMIPPLFGKIFAVNALILFLTSIKFLTTNKFK